MGQCCGNRKRWQSREVVSREDGDAHEESGMAKDGSRASMLRARLIPRGFR